MVNSRWVVVLAICWMTMKLASCQLGLRLRNVEYFNNSVIDLNDIGEANNALLCTTDFPNCCLVVRTGQWKYPNGSQIPPGTSGASMYRNRGVGYIRLNRKSNGFAEGLFCCQLQDHTAITQQICAHLYSSDSPPLLLSHPVNQRDIFPGDDVSFSVSVVGIGLSYRWQLTDGTLLPLNDQRFIGINSPTLTVRVVSGLDVGIYQCIISNSGGIVSSNGAQLTVSGPEIILQPMSVLSVDPGADVSFTVEVLGASLFDWTKSGEFLLMDTERLRGVRTTNLTILGVTLEDEGEYVCYASNGAVTVQSNLVHLSLLEIPIILQQPMDQHSVTPGSPVAFYVLVSGLRVSYSWEKSGSAPLPDTSRIEGKNSSTLTIHDVVSSDVGSYQCLVANAAGSVVSSNATLELGPLGPVEALEVSTQSNSVLISWEPPSILGGFTVLMYQLQYYPPAYPIEPIRVNISANYTSHEIVALIPGATYRLEVRVYTIKGPGEWGRTEATVHRFISAVENVTVQRTNGTSVMITWSPLTLPGWSPSYYLIYNAHNSANALKSVGGHKSSAEVDVTMVPANGIELELQVSAVFTLGLEGVGPFEGAKSDVVAIQLVPENALFQLHFGPVDYCVTWNVQRAQDIELHIRDALSTANCTHNTVIKEGAFSCRKDTNTVTYRSTIAGLAASETLNCIQIWVESGPIMKIEWYYVDIYTNCSSRIASLTEPECDTPADMPTPSLLIPYNNATSSCVNLCFSQITRLNNEMCNMV